MGQEPSWAEGDAAYVGALVTSGGFPVGTPSGRWIWPTRAAEEPAAESAKPTAAPTAVTRGVPPSVRSIMAEVASRSGVTVEELVSQSRLRRIAWPRQEAMYVVRALGRFSLPQIGRFFGGRDHTTVLAAINAYEERVRAHEGRVQQS